MTTYDDAGGPQFESFCIPDSLHSGSVKIRFHFTSDGSWSDEDCLWDTDGAIIIDSLTVKDATGIVVATDTFEDEAVGDTESNDWENCSPPGYGDFAGLFPGLTVVQEDPCVTNITFLWGFFNGSTVDYGCGGFPAQLTVPYENSRGQYISNEIWSPSLPFVGSGSQVCFRFDVYVDLPLNPLIFYVFHVRSRIGGCWGSWRDFSFVYGNTPGVARVWYTSTFDVGSLIEPSATDIQLALGVVDMCPFFGFLFGDCTCHGHSPLLDNVHHACSQLFP